MRLFCMGEGGLRSAPNVVSCEPCVFGRALPGGDRPAAPMNSTRWLATSSSPLFSVLTGEWEARDLGNMSHGHFADRRLSKLGSGWDFGQQQGHHLSFGCS